MTMNLLTRAITILGYTSSIIPSILYTVPVYKAFTFMPDTTLPNASQRITMDFQPFLKKMKIREENLIIQSLSDEWFYAVGTSYSNNHYAAINIDQDFCDRAKDACYFYIKHEIAHIKFHDSFTVNAVALLASSILTSISILSTRPESLIIVWPITYLVMQIFSQYTEGRADDFAISESSIKELEAIKMRWSKMSWTLSLSLSPYSFIINNLLSGHPSIDSRINKITRALKIRRAQIKRNMRHY